MILRIDKIEIQQQPERKRFWAEVEATTPSGFRCKRITTPDDQGHWGMLQAIGAYLDEFLPKPAETEELSLDDLRSLHSDAKAWDAVGRPEEWPALGNPEYWNAATLNTLNLLRAEAEAAGVRVDGRWGEARLREEIASVRRGEATQDA